MDLPTNCTNAQVTLDNYLSKYMKRTYLETALLSNNDFVCYCFFLS